MNKQKVLIVGGGFAGVKAALELAGYPNFEVTLISDQTHFRYYPRLYSIALGGSLGQSSIPLVRIFDKQSVELVNGTAQSIDREKKMVKLENGQTLDYDVLILALGVVTNYFGIKGLPEYSYGIKSLEDAEELKRHLHSQLADEHQPDLNYIIVGGGPTGIELAGALPGYLHRIMKNHGVNRKSVHIDLVEAAPSLAPRLPKAIGKSIARQLQHLGIRLLLGQAVKGETADNLMLGNERLPSHTVIWTAGAANHPFFKTNNFKLTEKGKVVVDEHLQAEPDIYVLGDNADTPYSGMAQTALRDAMFVGEHLKHQAEKKSLPAYKPKRPIYVMPAGPHWAAVCWGKLKLYGRPGWWLREAADFVALHDLLSWSRAVEEWLTEFERQEDCPTCAKTQLR